MTLLKLRLSSLSILISASFPVVNLILYLFEYVNIYRNKYEISQLKIILFV